MRHTSIALVCSLVSFSILGALPTGVQVSSGSADLTLSSPEVMRVLVSDQSILNWEGFSLEANEQVAFIQPNASSCVLNRVFGEEPSQIFGSILAKGKVLLINPNGILFGEDAKIDVGSLISSTLDIQDRDFLANDWNFTGDSVEGIQNLGTIQTTEGDLIFLSRRIENAGTLEAQNGIVGIGASGDILISQSGTKHLFIKPTNGGAFVDQSGKIEASRIEIGVDGNAYQLAFHHSGAIDAIAVGEKNGEIYLSVPESDAFISGSMQAKSGRIELLGQRLALMEGALIDVSGEKGGGTVLFGGDYQGKNPDVQNAEMIFVDPNATIRADAREIGDGGKVILWSDGATQMYGSVSAQGGAWGGNGGFVEVSGKAYLDYQGIVTTLAQNGKAGTLLLDPLDLTIAAANAFVTGASPFMPTGGACAPGPGNAILSAATLTGAGGLGGGNVIVQTTGTTGACPGNIIVSSAVNWATGTRLTLQSANNITINAAIQETGVATTGGVFLIAPGTITINPNAATAPVGSRNGITMVGDPSLTRCDRSRPTLTLQGGTGIGSGAQLGFGGNPVGASGSIDVTCGTLTLNGGTGLGSSAIIGHGPVAGTGVVLSTTAAASITVDASGNVTLQTNSATNTVAQIGHSGGLQLVTPGSTFLGDICVTTSGNLSISSVSPVFLNMRAQIGHGVTFGSFLTANGRIGVAARGNITTTSGFNSAISIGHYAQMLTPVTMSMIGNVNISCGVDFTLNQASNPTATYIGHAVLLLPTIPTITSDITISTGRDLTISQLGVGLTPCCFGSNATTLTGNLQMAIGRDFTFTSTPSTIPVVYNFGYSGPALSPGGAPNNTYIAVGRNLSMSTNAGYFYAVRAPNNLNIGALGSITFNRAGAIPNCTVTSLSAALGATRIFAGTSIGAQAQVLVGASGHSLDLRAGTNNQIFNGFAGNTGFITLGAGVQFAAGDIYSGGATQLASVCQQALPVFTLPACSTCTVIPFALIIPSAAVAPQCGTFNPALAFPQSFTTTSGAITLVSACNDCVANPINIGGAGSNLQIGTTSGNVSVTAFSDIALNQTLTTTTGNVTFSACNNLSVNQPITTTTGFVALTSDSDLSGSGNIALAANITTAGAPVTLLAGFGAVSITPAINQIAGQVSTSGGAITAQASGPINISSPTDPAFTSGAGNQIIRSTGSNINIFQDVISTAGMITVIADIGNVNIAAGLGAIETTTGNIDITAGNDVNIDGEANTLFSLTGNINSVAGNDTNVTRNVLTAGTVQMISGNSLFLNGSANISSTGSSVTLVVDQNFPAAPLIGTGLFSLPASASINAATQLRIFTAQQPFNSILGSITVGGVPFVFTRGTLFVNTAEEVWCTYFDTAPAQTSPFRVYYKNCLQQVTQQATIIVQQFFFNLDNFNNLNWPYYGYNEYYGWPARFFIIYHLAPGMEAYKDWPSEPYFLRKHNDLLLTPYSNEYRRH